MKHVLKRTKKAKKNVTKTKKTQIKLPVPAMAKAMVSNTTNLKSSKLTKKTKKTKNQHQQFRLSPAQDDQYQINYSLYSKKSAADLKQLLRQNNQVMTGSKCDLISRCAQGKLLGGLPHCELCHGGKLRFDIKTGVYTCPGFMDDTDFKNCHALRIQ